jgi:hypothetical protein
VTYDQAAAKKDKAERFVRDVLRDDSRADEIADESVEDFADRKKYVISNPRKVSIMANGNGQTKQDLLDQISDLQDENDALSAQLDAIQDVLSGVDDDGDDAADYDDDDPDNGQS